jgi:hypothetical protein
MPAYLDGKMGNDGGAGGRPCSLAVLFAVTHTEMEANQGRGTVARHGTRNAVEGGADTYSSDRHGNSSAAPLPSTAVRLATGDAPTWRGQVRPTVRDDGVCRKSQSPGTERTLPGIIGARTSAN